MQALTEGRGSDYTLEAAGPADAQAQAILMTRRAGTVVLTGLAAFGTTVTVSARATLRSAAGAIHSCQNGKCRMSRDIPRYVKMSEWRTASSTRRRSSAAATRSRRSTRLPAPRTRERC